MSQLSTTLRIKIWKQRKMQNKISRKEMLKKCEMCIRDRPRVAYASNKDFKKIVKYYFGKKA